MRPTRRVLVGALCAALLGAADSAALANAAHHPGSGSSPTPAAVTAAPVSPATAPAAAPASIPGPTATSQVTLSIDSGGIPAPVVSGTAGEVSVTDNTDLGVSLEKDARQPTLYDLMMRIMNLMQPHMKEMMGGIPAPDLSASPNRVVDLANPLGIRSVAKATPETGGSGSLVVQPDGSVFDPVAANMGGMAGTSSTAPAGSSSDEVKRLTAEVEALKQQLAQVLAALKAGTGGSSPSQPPEQAPAGPAAATAPSDATGIPPAETRLSL